MVFYFKKIIYLRKGNDNKIKPVPGVTKASKIIYTEASCKDFYQKFKSINSSESVPMRKHPKVKDCCSVIHHHRHKGKSLKKQ